MRRGDGETAAFAFVGDAGDSSNFFNDAGEHAISLISPQRHRDTEKVIKQNHARNKKSWISLCLCVSVVQNAPQSEYGSFKYPSTAKSSPKRCRRIDLTWTASPILLKPAPATKGMESAPPRILGA